VISRPWTWCGKRLKIWVRRRDSGSCASVVLSTESPKDRNFVLRNQILSLRRIADDQTAITLTKTGISHLWYWILFRSGRLLISPLAKTEIKKIRYPVTLSPSIDYHIIFTFYSTNFRESVDLHFIFESLLEKLSIIKK
jgi:hypothetical protein